MAKKRGTRSGSRASSGSWLVKLHLSRHHWHDVEDIADAIRRDGTFYRPGASEIIRGVLDAALPILRLADFCSLAEETAERDRVTSRALVRSWTEGYLKRRLKELDEDSHR